MAVKFYNPGSRIYEKLAFDHPVNDVTQMNLVAYFQVDAPARSFFEVPTEVEVETDNGPQSVSVRFADRIQADYRSLGVVRVNAKPKQPIGEDENVALTDKEAQKKAERLWRDAMVELVREHKRLCDEARNHGLTPQRARGTVKHAMEELGIEDPANDVADVLKRSRDDDRVKKLEEELAELRSAILKGAAK
jgi:hypothetical protein